jgi:YbbR domain-containing protein
VGEVLVTAWRRIDVRRLFLGDLLLKSAAVGVALLLWVTAVRSAPAPDVTAAFDGRVPVERPDVPGGFVLRAQLGDVAVRLRGPEDAVRAVGLQQLRATLDVSGLSPQAEPQEAPVRVVLADDRVRVVEVTPASVPVRFERRVFRVLVVQARLANDPPAGYQAAPATFRPQQVTVAGPESAVAGVAAALATVRFGDTPVDLAQDVRPVPVDAAGQAIADVEVDPVAVHVTVPVVSTATTRTLPIQYQVRGDVATGYWISRVVTDPVAVTVSGDRDTIAALDRVGAATVDVSGLSAARAFTVPLALPVGVSVVGSPEVTVSVTVVVLAGTRPFPLVAVDVVGLGPGLAADVSPGTVEVILAGTIPTLAALGADAVRATVDMTGRGPGTYTADVAVTAPPGTTVQTLRSARATVTIRSTRPTPSPSPAGSP